MKKILLTIFILFELSSFSQPFRKLNNNYIYLNKDTITATYYKGNGEGLTGIRKLWGAEVFSLKEWEVDAVNPPASGLQTALYTLDFDKSTDELIAMIIPIPSDYNAEDTIQIHYDFFTDGGALLNDTTVVWGLKYKLQQIGDILNFTIGTTTTLDTVTWTGSATQINDGEFNLVTTGFQPEDHIQLQIYRDANNGADNYNGDARLLYVQIRYHRF